MKNALSLPGGSQEAVRGDEHQTQPTAMNTKPFFSSTQTIKETLIKSRRLWILTDGEAWSF